MKFTPAMDNIILVVVNLDPYHHQSGNVDVPFNTFGFTDRGDVWRVRDLLTNERYDWRHGRNYVALDPQSRPAHVLRVER